MIPSIKKILARCDGNLTRTMGYCSDMAQNYPGMIFLGLTAVGVFVIIIFGG